MARIRHLLGSERGVSFIEMMVATSIASLVGILLISTMNMTLRVDRFTREDSQALAELRVASERFAKELRQARKIYDDSTATRLHVWVDRDIDNQQDPSERAIWEFQTSGGEMRLVRTTDQGVADGDPVRIVASELTAASSFAYSPAPPDTTLMTLNLVGDVSAGSASGRTVRVEVRLRNAAA